MHVAGNMDIVPIARDTRLDASARGRSGIAEAVLADRTGFVPCLVGPTLGTVSRSFTASGRLAGWVEPNGDEYTRIYDKAGRVKEEIDALGNSTG
jgi:YD repeat-containing protein